jgi:DNA-binding PadR family transcriptional regulator
MKAWGKDRTVDVSQRATLYKTIERLRTAGLIEVKKTERDQRFPERTVYGLTDEGLRVGREWLTEMLATPRNEFPEFPAALSFVFGLTPDEALAALERRARRLRESVAEIDRELHSEAGPPRLFLLETEYVRTIAAAELKWVNGVVDDLRAGRLGWKLEDFADIAKNFTPPDSV